MRFDILDTQDIYQRLLTERDPATQEEILREEIIAPYRGLVSVFGGGDELAMFRQWGISLDLFNADNRAHTQSVLDQLIAFDAWRKSEEALADAKRAFGPLENNIPLDRIVFGLLIMSAPRDPLDRGYTGFGGLPGYVMALYNEPNDYNLPRIKGLVAHELHHNIRFTLFPFSMQITLGEYIIAEGLAEAFAAELYGDDVVGYYVTDFNDAELDHARNVISGALDVTGFNEVRAYIFGDVIAEDRGLPKARVPNFAGYAIGYRIVREYQKRTGKAVAETSFVPAEKIIRESAYFADA